jgi:S-adenosylmethionine decarboxylase
MYDCDPEVLNDEEKITRYMLQAAEISGATIVGEVFHRFSPHGVSGAVVIAESHLSIHTWPEYRYAALDLFTCGDNVDPWKGFTFLRKKLRAERLSQTELRRGMFPFAADQDLPFKPGS